MKMGKAWTDADADQDGKLNFAEYKAFDATVKAIGAEDGIWQESADHCEENYNILNSISEGEGIGKADFFKFQRPWMAKWEQLKSEASQ